MQIKPAWRTSSYSGGQGNCVEVATNLAGQVLVRDSKNPDGARLVFSRQAWAAFTESAKGKETVE